MRIAYQQSRRQYRREAYHATREQTEYDVPPTSVRAAQQRFARIVELPSGAHNIGFHADGNELPERYRHALQKVR